jgi:uncharacterized membrane protein
MTLLVVGLILFLGVHSISIFANSWRDRTAARLGMGWRGLYSLLALVGLILIIKGYAAARLTPIVIYIPPYWIKRLTDTLMLPVFPLLLATYLPGRIKSTVKHPMLAAVKLWAFAHLLANGMLADVLLFGGFLAWAIVDRISLKRRPQRPIKTAPPGKYNDWIAVVGGVVLYGMVMGWAHLKFIGVRPF